MKSDHHSIMDRARPFLALASFVALIGASRASADAFAAPVPEGVRAVWDSTKAYRETTPTREQTCLNGLWRWQPANALAEEVPSGQWGWFKVPGCWPGITDYVQKDSQRVHPHPSWQDQKLGTLTAAWHQREFTIPDHWAGRRIAFRAEYLNSYAAVFVDGKRAGVLRFPGGELDLTSSCRPGAAHVLSILVVAMPLQGIVLSYTDSASAREVKGSVSRRGFCGDVFLVSRPSGARIAETRVETSVRKKQIAFDVAIEGLAPSAPCSARARILRGGDLVREFTSPGFLGSDLKEGRFRFSEAWLPDTLWDLHTPQNTFELEFTLLDGAGGVRDIAWPVRFGFREFWIEGRDFFLNGTRLQLSALPLDNAQVSTALARYSAARESLERLKSFGINFVYTHNYGCEPGSHLGFSEILRAADDAGMLVSFSQPHFSHYDWQGPTADRNNGYARHAAYYVQAAQNHPSVVMYSMSHNATGYNEDMDPDLMDGLQDVRDRWASNNARLALRAEALVQGLDPSRIVYHHASGNLGSMHAVNFYPNFVPIQELSDWFGHWAVQGVKPMFLCEYGAPFSWDWTMYRGWYRGQREFGSAKVPWDFAIAEWNAQFFGDRAYRISQAERVNVRWEANQFRAGNTWHRWDYPHSVSSKVFDERYPVFAKYLTDNWRAFRTWGVSAISPWEHEHFWKLREGVDRRPREFEVDWETLQKPGFSPDYERERYERMDLAYEQSDWIATSAALALLRNNRPLLAYLGGKPERFTSKDHLFLPGESVEKQIIIINNSRIPENCDCEWSLSLPQVLEGRKTLRVAPGQQERLPLRFDLPPALAPGSYRLSARFKFDSGETQEDDFAIDVLPASKPAVVEANSKAIPRVGSVESVQGGNESGGTARLKDSQQRQPSTRERGQDVSIAVFDPQGETKALLNQMGIQGQAVTAGADVSGFDIFILGKAALSNHEAAPDIKRVREGLKVIVFEQTSAALEKRLGFRVQEYGLRQVFPRVPDHPILAGLKEEHLRDWRGEATILAPQLACQMRPRYGPTVSWCNIPVTRLWRCGNRGNVASVLIEKPARGDFMPILDGGYSLQYSPLLEYREGQGMVLFCQMDVTGRTERDPAAETLAQNLIRYVTAWKPPSRRKVVYAGDADGKSHLEAVGVAVSPYLGGNLSSEHLLVVGPGGTRLLSDRTSATADWIQAGGACLAIGLGQEELATLLPFKVSTKKSEHIAAYFEAAGIQSLLAGVGPADVHNRDPRELPLILSGAQSIGDGILALGENGNVVLCQLVPWQFQGTAQSNLKRTHRHVSFLVSRLLANLGASSATPLLDRLHRPAQGLIPEKRWLQGFYLDTPEEWDDPYRFFRW